MSPTRIVSLAAAFFLTAPPSLRAAPPDIEHLRAQLQLATRDQNALARIELLRRILDLSPGDDLARAQLIELWLSIGDYDMADASLAAWADAPRGLAALTRAKILRFRDKDATGAVRTLNDYLAGSPGDTLAWQFLVDTLSTGEDHSATLQALDALVKLEKTAATLLQRADIKVALGDYAGAVADAAAAQALEPDFDRVKNALPRYARLEETLAALPPLDAALASNPQNFAALVERAWWFLYGGVPKRTVADSDVALIAFPSSLAARILKFDALHALDEAEDWKVRQEQGVDVHKSIYLSTAQDIATSDAALAGEPKDAELFAARASALIDAGQFLLAQADAEHALQADPRNARAALEGIYATTMLGSDPAPFLRRLETMKPSKSQLARANSYLAEMYFRQSSLALALDFANRSLAAQESEHVLRVQAAVLQRLNRHAEATAALKRADALRK